MKPPIRMTALRARGIAALVFCSALALYTLTAGGSLTSTDAVVTFDLTSSLVERHSMALSGNVLGLEANRGVDGRFYSQYGIGQSIYNIPFYIAGKLAARLAPRRIGKPDTLLKAAVAMGSAVAAALAVLLIWSLSHRLGATPRGACIAALTAAISSPLWPYSKFGFSTALTAALLIGAVRLLAEVVAPGTAGRIPGETTGAKRGIDAAPHPGARDVRYAAAAGVVIGFGWLTRHEMALLLLPFGAALVLAARERRTQVPWRPISALAGAAAAGGVLWAWYNIVRFGSPVSVGYSPRLDVSGYAAFLIAPAGSIALFAPVAIVWGIGIAWARWGASIRVLLIGPVITFYAFYGALADWAGGRSYGPRYLVPFLVLLAPGAAALWDAGGRRRRIVLAVCVVAALFQLPGVLVDYSKVSVDWAGSASQDAIANRNWRVASSPIVLDTAAMARAVPANIAYLSGRRPPPRVATSAGADDRGFAQQLSFSIDFWWVYLFYLRAIGSSAALVCAAVLLVACCGCAGAAWRLAG